MVCAMSFITSDDLKALAAEYDLQLDDDTIDYIIEKHPERLKRLAKIRDTHRYGLSGTPFYQWAKFELLQFASDKTPYPRPEAKPDRVFYDIEATNVVYEVAPTAIVCSGKEEPKLDHAGGYYALALRRREEVIATMDSNEFFA